MYKYFRITSTNISAQLGPTRHHARAAADAVAARQQRRQHSGHRSFPGRTAYRAAHCRQGAGAQRERRETQLMHAHGRVAADSRLLTR